MSATGDADWQAALDAFLRGLADAGRLAPAAQFRQLAHLLGIYSARYAEWRSDGDVVGPAFGTLLGDLQARIDALLALADKGPAWPEPVLAALEAFARRPGLGPHREAERGWRALGHALARFSEAARVLEREGLEVARAGLAELAAEIERTDAPPVTSLRALYDLMVDCAERAYRARVMTDAYARRFGAYVNAAMALRHSWLAIAGRWLAGHDIATRGEIDALARRVRAAAAEVPDAAALAALAARVEQLERELEALRATSAAAAPRPVRAAARRRH